MHFCYKDTHTVVEHAAAGYSTSHTFYLRLPLYTSHLCSLAALLIVSVVSISHRTHRKREAEAEGKPQAKKRKPGGKPKTGGPKSRGHKGSTRGGRQTGKRKK